VQSRDNSLCPWLRRSLRAVSGTWILGTLANLAGEWAKREVEWTFCSCMYRDFRWGLMNIRVLITLCSQAIKVCYPSTLMDGQEREVNID
jgi:hypothetical protein